MLGPYELRGELGRGGMGVVYRAWRPDLEREFALKVIGGGVGSSTVPTGGEAALVERFRREAAAGGRLAGHPGIVGIHDIGEADGRLYIAMDLVEGRPLDQWIAEGELTPVQVAELIRDLARAVQYAHEQGVLHRDLKPSNVLVAEEGGALVPRVTDFGLARSEQNDAALTRLTRSGELLGTPAYMPPEQARGEPLDARADVYALGACLYEALAARPPFGGDSIYGVIARVLREPPPPLRTLAPHTPEPLERVAACCLAKQRDDRYESAAALAEDLDRFITGAPVLARRPARPGAGAGLKLAAGVLVSVAAVVVAILTIPSLGDGGKAGGAADRADATEAARGLVEQAAGASAVYFAMTLQLRSEWEALEDHWNGPELDDDALAAALAAIDGKAAALAAAHGGTNQPAAWQALARWYAANRSGDDRAGAIAALQQVAAAAGADPFPHLLYARALLAGYAREVTAPATVRSAAGVTLDAFTESPRCAGLRTEAAAALAAAAGSPLWPHLTEGRGARDFGRAAGALTAGRYAESAALLEPLDGDPLLGRDAARLRALALYLAGDFRGSALAWEPLAARGWVAAPMRAAKAWTAAAAVAGEQGADVGPLFDRAEAALDQAIAIGANTQAAVEERAMLHFERAAAAERLGGDPVPSLRKALADADLVLAQAPASSGAWQVRGMACLSLARWQREHGEDDLATCREAVAASEAVVRLRPDRPSMLMNLASARSALARAEARRGADPRPALRQVLAELNRVLEMQPGLAPALLNRGHTHKELARAQARRGGDPMPHYGDAIADMRAVLAANPEYVLAAYNLGIVLVERGRRLAAAGTDPAAGYREAIEVYTAALRVNPQALSSLTSRGVAHRALGDWLRTQQAEFLPEWDRAEADYRAALDLAPKDDGTWFNLGNLLFERARLVDGTPAAAAPLDAALEAFDRAYALNRRHWQGQLIAGVIHENRGRPESALRAYQAVLQHQPQHALAARRAAALRAAGR